MKKFSIRSLLIVILALILVFALVACGDKDKGNNNNNPNTPTKPTKDTTNVKAFFNTLWDKSTGIGDEAIGASDDLKVSLGLTVQLDLVDSDGNSQESVDVGILLDLVLDRSSGKDKSTNTAIKAKIYDPSKEENWFTAYYFFNDVDNVYIDYAGQNIKIPFSYLNDTYNKSFYNFIFNEKVIGKDEKDATKGKTIADIITALTKNMGKNWDLNTLVGDVMRVFNINVDSLKEEIGDVFSILGLSVDEAFDAQGNINIKNVLTNDTVAGFFVNDNTTTSTKDGVTTYTTQLSSEVLNLVSSLSSTLKLPGGLTDLIDGLKLYLEFTTKNNAIDSFTIRAGLPSLESEIVTTSKNDKGETEEKPVDVYPVVAITITDLNFAKAKEGEIEKSMVVERGNYTTDVVLDAAVELDLTGITLDATALDQDNYKRFSNVNKALNGGLENLKLDGTLALTLNGKLDLAGTTEDGTVAAAALTYKAAGATTAVDIVKASFMDGNLALTVNQDAKVGDVGIVDVLVRLFGDYAYTWIRDEFFEDDQTELDKFADVFFASDCKIKEQVAVDENGNNKVDPQDRVITINPEFKGAVWKKIDIVEVFQDLLDDIFNDEEEETPNDSASAQYASDPIIKKVSETIVRALPLVSAKGDKLTIKTNSNATLKKNYGTVGSAISYIGQTWWEKKAPSFIDSIIKADNDKWHIKVANALTVAGTTYGNETDAAKKGKAFLDEMFASTAEVVLDISGANGLELSVNVDVNDKAGVGVSVKLGAKAYNKANYTDLTPAANKEAGWYIYTVPEKQA